MLTETFSGIASLLTGSGISFILLELALLLLAAAFIWFGSKIAQVEKAGIGRAFLTAILVTIVAPLLMIPFEGLGLLTLVISIILTLFFIKVVFSTGWRKSLVTWIFSIIAQVVWILIMLFLLVLI